VIFYVFIQKKSYFDVMTFLAQWWRNGVADVNLTCDIKCKCKIRLTHFI